MLLLMSGNPEKCGKSVELDQNMLQTSSGKYILSKRLTVACRIHVIHRSGVKVMIGRHMIKETPKREV